jgi:hypothetical protein
VSRFRPPIVAGVSGGVGTTTLALALHGHDAGLDTAEADVLVCRSSVESLDRAARIADLAWPGRYPVLLVTLDGTERRPPARLARLHDRWTAVVPVPHIAPWRDLVDPYREAAGLLGSPRADLPRPVRALLDAIGRAARVVADSGRLSGPPAGWAPAPDGPPPGADWRAARPLTTPRSLADPHGTGDQAGSIAPGGPPRDRDLSAPAPPAPLSGPAAQAPGRAQPVLAAAGTSAAGIGAAAHEPADRDVSGVHAADSDLVRDRPVEPGSAGEPEPLRLIHSPVESTVDSTGCGEPGHRLRELRPVRGIRVLDAGGVAG